MWTRTPTPQSDNIMSADKKIVCITITRIMIAKFMLLTLSMPKLTLNENQLFLITSLLTGQNIKYSLVITVYMYMPEHQTP